MYGQIPIVYNVGLQYDGERFGANIAWNYMGYKTFTAGTTPEIVEYERPRGQMDAQLSYVFLKDKKMKVKLNMSNLLNTPYQFYVNGIDTYKYQDKWKGVSPGEIYYQTEDWSEIYEWKYGFNQKYDKGYLETSQDGKTKTRIGDKDTFYRKVGTSFSLSFSYSF